MNWIYEARFKKIMYFNCNFFCQPTPTPDMWQTLLMLPDRKIRKLKLKLVVASTMFLKMIHAHELSLKWKDKSTCKPFINIIIYSIKTITNQFIKLKRRNIPWTPSALFPLPVSIFSSFQRLFIYLFIFIKWMHTKKPLCPSFDSCRGCWLIFKMVEKVFFLMMNLSQVHHLYQHTKNAHEGPCFSKVIFLHSQKWSHPLALALLSSHVSTHRPGCSGLP